MVNARNYAIICESKGSLFQQLAFVSTFSFSNDDFRSILFPFKSQNITESIDCTMHYSSMHRNFQKKNQNRERISSNEQFNRSNCWSEVNTCEKRIRKASWLWRHPMTLMFWNHSSFTHPENPLDEIKTSKIMANTRSISHLLHSKDIPKRTALSNDKSLHLIMTKG